MGLRTLSCEKLVAVRSFVPGDFLLTQILEKKNRKSRLGGERRGWYEIAVRIPRCQRGVGGDVGWMNGGKHREREKVKRSERNIKTERQGVRWCGIRWGRWGGKRGSEQLATAEARAALIFSRDRTRKPFYAHPRLIIRRTRKMKRPRTKRSRANPPGNACPSLAVCSMPSNPMDSMFCYLFLEETSGIIGSRQKIVYILFPRWLRLGDNRWPRRGWGILEWNRL